MSKKANTIESLPYDVIVDAVKGNADAMNAVIQHYSGYIMSLSTRRYFDAFGICHTRIDEGLRQQLETRLIIATTRFDLT